MVEFTKGAIIAIIGGIVAIITVFLPWWTISYGINHWHLNPLFGMNWGLYYYIPHSYNELVILGGILALVGGILLITTLIKRPLGIIGGIVALSGPIAFIVIMALGTFYLGAYELLGLFGSYPFPPPGLNWYLNIGTYVACVGGAIGLVGALLGTKEA